MIILDRNQIQNVHPDVFDFLNNLKYLSFNLNFCTNKIADNREKTEHLIEDISKTNVETLIAKSFLM